MNEFATHPRVVVAERHRETGEHLRRDATRLQRELSFRRSLAARHASDLDDEPNLSPARHRPRGKQRTLGVDCRKLYAVVGISEDGGNRAGGFSVVGVLQNLNGSKPRRGVRMFQS